MFVALEHEQARGRALETEYGQLQLEQSTWGMPARVEKIAREQLRMQLPSAARTDVVALPDVTGATK
jgi:cell division protein FtsL